MSRSAGGTASSAGGSGASSASSTTRGSNSANVDQRPLWSSPMGEWINAAEAAQRLGVKQATLYAYVSRGMLARHRGQDGRSSLFEAEEVARLADRGQRGEPRRAAGTGDFVIESELTEVADGRIRYRGLEVTKLALWRPFEEVAAWLWTGGLSKDAPWE